MCNIYDNTNRFLHGHTLPICGRNQPHPPHILEVFIDTDMYTVQVQVTVLPQTAILRIAQVPDAQAALQTVPWFLEDGSRGIVRHPLNTRKQASVRMRYKRGILVHGIMEECRGEAWLLQPASSREPYLAIAFGTLCLSFNSTVTCNIKDYDKQPKA